MKGARCVPFDVTSVGTASGKWLAASEYRRCIIISAPNGGRVSIAPGSTAVLDKGITIQPGDPVFIMPEDWFG